MTDFQNKFQRSLEQLDLQGIVLLQGLLAERALQLMNKPEKKSSIIKIEKDG